MESYVYNLFARKNKQVTVEIVYFVTFIYIREKDSRKK
jgi:hypothetical protein